MEFRKTKRYVYSILGDDYTAAELVGTKALNLNRLRKSNVEIPNGFVISGAAFDEFLVYNNLVEKMVDSLNQLNDPSDRKLGEKANDLRALILDGTVPKKLVIEIDKAYHSLGRHADTSVIVRQSALHPALDEVNFDRKNSGYLGVRGIEGVLEHVIITWADLFTEQAIRYRLENDYEGNLSQAVIVQKMVNPEISGVMYNFDFRNSKNSNDVSVLAQLGVLVSATDLDPISLDYYVLDKVRSAVKSKQTQSQKFMLVRSAKADGDLYTKVKISKVWSERDKLEEQQLLKLNTVLGLIESSWLSRFEVEWAYESGAFYVLEIRELTEADLVTISELAKQIEPQSNATPKKEKEIDTKEDTAAKIRLTSTAEDVVATTSVEARFDPLQQLGQLELEEDEREQIASRVTQMLPEIKTATEVWWDAKRPASEVKVLRENVDGLGIYKLDEVVSMLGGGDLVSSQSLQKQVCEYLALYLKAISPKPVIIELSASQDLEGQIQTFSQLRNLYGHRNFWFSLPELTNHQQISTYKKELSAASFRRTSSFKIYQLVAQPIYLAAVSEIFDQGVDGVVLDVDRIIERMYGRDLKDVLLHIDHEGKIIKDYLLSAVLVDSKIKTQVILQTGNRDLFELLLKPMLDAGINGLSYSWEDVYDFKQNLVALESDILTSSLKKIKSRLNKL